MAKTVDQIRQQIAKLQLQEQALLAKEIDGVVAKIRIAVAHYGLTPEHIFGGKAASKTKAAPGRKTHGVKAEARTGSKPSKGAIAGSTPARHASVPRGTKLAAKYKDDAGNSWTGRGSQPRWLRAAIESGRSLEDFLIRGIRS
ncbi:hypothetical protein CDN99_19585 [Roseateles aquatilis]|uniref:DNA-binding protein H-NS-like C-terminal domain-containing protein n=1 Tax=Roseateles aquatilis TaxID=431061 RepID=A0A246J2U9_9BURK|nr:H-NS histone family protein [Roseateles aquatilis]OWQ86909.1 hypothetical protein CDN99_19585 [Roseateles aquatilis]